MKTIRLLYECRIGDTVNIQGVLYKVEYLRDCARQPIDEITIRRCPTKIRSQWLARLRDSKGRVRSTWFAEFIRGEIVGDLIASNHAARRMKSRDIPYEDLELVVKHGLVKNWLNRTIYRMSHGYAKSVGLPHLGGINVVVRNNIIVTSYRDKR